MTPVLLVALALACLAVITAELVDWRRGAQVGPLWPVVGLAGLSAAAYVWATL